MGFSTIDYLVLVAYLAGITAFGVMFRKSQRTVKDYFLGDKNTSWIVISLSIVATETSTLTLIGVPALAYANYARPEQGGNFTYLQVVLGYIVARIIISFLFIPAYFRGNLLTAYELLKNRFGVKTKNFAASLFLIMRALAEGVRVFAASLVLSAVLSASLPGLPYLWLWSIIISGFVVLFQFTLFLTIGVMLYVYYKSSPLTTKLASNDEIFPTFIVQRLPHGISGLVIAAIFAAAMSNLSGSLNSLSSSTVLDFYKPLLRPHASDDDLLKLSRWLTAAWGLVLIGIAILARSWGSVFTTGLTIASLVYGPMLGAFLLGVLTRRANQIGVMIGMAVSLVVMLFIRIQFATAIAWTWYVLFGTIICFTIGYAVSLIKPAGVAVTENVL